MKSEATVQDEIRLRASETGVMLFRNNVGACNDDTGRIIRFGLGNDSAQLSRRLKSSDLIGWVTIDINPVIFNVTPGQFVSIEAKREGWKFRASDDRAVAQKAWIDLVRAGGGIAGFCASVEDFDELIQTGKTRHG